MKKHIIAKVCNLIGVLLMLAVIVVMAPMTVPKFFGYNVYAVLTESMTPAYSVGSVVYVQKSEPEDIEVGDVITFQLGTNTENVMTHRVVEIDSEEGTFRTKGDANNAVDSEPVQFKRLIGKVVLCIPHLAGISNFVNSTTGKAVTFIAFALAFILWIAADMLEPKKKQSATTKRKKVDILQVAVCLVGVTLVIGSGTYLFRIFMEYRAGENEYEELQKIVFAQAPKDTSVKDSSEKDDSTDNSMDNFTQQGGTENEAGFSPSEMDLQVMKAISSLKEENPDVIGWITFDNMELSYPIMQGEDNEYYLTHTFSGEKNSAGSIFMEAANTSNFEDCHTIIYGHNMKNLSMFGRLKNYKKEQFYEEHQYFTIYTEENVYRYQIFAYYDISEVGDIYTVGFLPDEAFQEFINKMIRRSYHDTDIEVTEQDKVITLSTCSSEGNRFVVNAKRINN